MVRSTFVRGVGVVSLLGPLLLAGCTSENISSSLSSPSARPSNVALTAKPPAPTIGHFTATPATIAPGGSSTLAWSGITGTPQACTINEGVGPVTCADGSVVVSPSATTTYTLTVAGLGGAVHALATVTIDATPHGTATFSYTGFEQTWEVPAGVTQVTIEAFGAQGGAAANLVGDPGGNGGAVTATISVTAGPLLAIFVGGAGGQGPAAGFNGGGDGGDGVVGGGGGGGASDVRQNGIRVVVAGGGGGRSGTFPRRWRAGGSETGAPGSTVEPAALAVARNADDQAARRALWSGATPGIRDRGNGALSTSTVRRWRRRCGGYFGGGGVAW